MRFPDERFRSDGRSRDPAAASVCTRPNPGRRSGRRSRPELPDPRRRETASVAIRYGSACLAFTIMHNQHVNDVRHGVREGISVEIGEAPQLTVESNAIPTLELRDLERALAKLPHEQREVILLVGLEGMRYEQVAEILDVPIGTVRSRLSRGRDQLRRLMGMEEKLGGSGQPQAA